MEKSDVQEPLFGRVQAGCRVYGVGITAAVGI